MNTNTKNQFQIVQKRGLDNLGNTCYIGSIIQCLANIEELNSLLLNKELFNLAKKNEKDNSFLLALSRLFLTMKNPRQFDENNLKSVLRNFCQALFDSTDQFVRGQQSDASEFLLILIGYLSEKCRPLIDQLIRDQGPQFFQLENILDQFQVGLQQNIICQNGHASSSHSTDFIAVEVDMQSTSLQMCLQSFFRTERLTNCTCGAIHNPLSRQCNSFKCDMCNGYVGGQKFFRISHFPDILIIQLKLFSFSQAGQVRSFKKIKYF